MGRDLKAECENEISAIARNKDFWENHIPFLKEAGVLPTPDQIHWVERHIEGLDKSSEYLKSLIKTIKGPTNA